MKPSRRRFLSTSAAGAISLSTAGTVQAAAAATSSDEDRTTPSPLDKDSEGPVIAEVYGELDLSKNNPSWDYEFPLFREPAIVEYEVQVDDPKNAPDVLLVDGRGREKYRTQIEHIPLVDTRTLDLGWAGSVPYPAKVYTENLNLETVLKKMEQQQDWTVESIVGINAVDCLTEKRATQASHRIDTGSYHIVFDWTDEVLSEPGSDDVTVDVAIRARYEKDDDAVAEEAIDAIGSFYTMFSTDKTQLAATMVPVAKEICNLVPEEMDNVTISDINRKAPRAQQVVAATRAVFTILENKLDYRPSFVWDMLDGAATWTRWAGSVLPVVSSIEQLIDDSCAVANAEPDTVTDNVENLLMSLGILVAEFLMIKFGLVSRAATIAVRQAHTYLLGIVREVLGLKTYLALLRELYTLTMAGIRQVLAVIKDITREIGDEYEFFSQDDVDAVDDMKVDELQSLNLDWDVNLGPFDPSPECYP